MKKKVYTILTLMFILIIPATLVLAAGPVPIVDGTGLLSISSTSWDVLGHNLGGLQVERGNGFVTFVLPRSYNHTSVWAVHGYVTYTDATINSVAFSNTNFFKLEGGGDDGVASIVPTYDDEFDWVGDSNQVSTGAWGVNNSSELEFWFATNSARDAVTTNLSYGFCPYMTVELVDLGQQSYGGAETLFEIEGMQYEYPAFVPLAECIVDIDIKPGSDPSCFNNDGHGVIPLAILGSADLDVYEIDAGSVMLEGLIVAVRGKSNKLLAAYEDVNNDGFTDLVIKIEDQDGVFSQGISTATVTGNFFDGRSFEGSDEICITQ